MRVGVSCRPAQKVQVQEGGGRGSRPGSPRCCGFHSHEYIELSLTLNNPHAHQTAPHKAIRATTKVPHDTHPLKMSSSSSRLAALDASPGSHSCIAPQRVVPLALAMNSSTVLLTIRDVETGPFEIRAGSTDGGLSARIEFVFPYSSADNAGESFFVHW